MDQCIEKMNGILNEITRKSQTEKLTREQILDYYQEMYRQNFILNHIGRAYKNPAGRYTGLLFGAIGGYCIGASGIKINQKGLLVYATLITYTTLGGAFGYWAFSSYYGSRSEYKVYRRKRLVADEVNSKFEEVVNLA